MKNLIKGAIVLAIGGSVYSFSQTDVAENLSRDTGMTVQEAEQYVESIPEDELVSFDEVGYELIDEGRASLQLASEIDCENYEYDWETANLSCLQGKRQLERIGNSEINLGNAYVKLSSDAATSLDISATIVLIDELNENYSLPIMLVIFEPSEVSEIKKTNSFNKSMLQAALDSE